MAYDAVLARLDTMLSGLAISSPVMSGIKHVYTTPRASISEFPCWVIIPPEDIQVERTNAAVRTETDVFVCRYMGLQGSAWDTAAEIAQAYRQAAIVAFDNITLGGDGLLMDQQFEPIELTRWGNRDVVAFNMRLVIRHQAAASIT